MANLKDIKKRITSVKNTRQITRAMKMVSAAKLRRAQDNVVAARPYAYRIYSLLLSLAQEEGVTHPLLVKREEKKSLLLVLAGDRGLCGSFNASIFKATEAFIKEKTEQGIELRLECIGKKANDYFSKRTKVQEYHQGLLTTPRYDSVIPLADSVLKEYREEELDAVYLVYNEFKSAIQQKVTVERLIPVSTDVPESVSNLMSEGKKALIGYKFEPERDKILDEVVPRHFRMQLFRAVLESVASEHGARMSAMENATTNASEMIEKLTLEYNKARQASITTELMEIIGGVEAMK